MAFLPRAATHHVWPPTQLRLVEGGALRKDIARGGCMRACNWVLCGAGRSGPGRLQSAELGCGHCAAQATALTLVRYW